MNKYYSHTLLVLAGPTAVGKTTVAIELAKKLNSVVISADSRQCYQELNIGVARPTAEELAAVHHYFIASHSIHQKVDAAYYENYALQLVDQLFQQYKVVIVTGGTGLYLKALVEGLDPIPKVPENLRAEIIENYQTRGIGWLQDQLIQKDGLFAAEGEMQNPQRMMRALEVVEATGLSVLSFRTGNKQPRNFNVLQVNLELPREQLYERINTRVDAMMAAGLETEASTLIAFRQLNALQTVGYNELFQYFDGTLTLQHAVELIKQNTRRYAKRQMTWFNKQAQMHRINNQDPKLAMEQILELLKKLESF